MSVVFAAVLADLTLSQDDLPNADEVVERFIKETGGRDKYKSIKTGKLVSSTRINGTPEMSFKSVMYVQTPNRYFQIIKMNGEFYSERGSNGKVHWTKNKKGKYELEKLGISNNPVTFFTLREYTNPESYYKSRSMIGRVKVLGENCFAVKSKDKNDVVRTEYFSEKTGLLEKSCLTPKGATTANVFHYKEYVKANNGILFPKFIMLVEPLSGQTVNENMQINLELDKKLFELPDEVKKLVVKKK